MSFAYPWAGLVTIGALIVLQGTGIMVGRARKKFGIPAPATSGNPDFERVFRAHMNTLEQFAFFLPGFWLAALVFSERWAAVLGLIWIIGRILYARGYYASAEARGPGFVMSTLSAVILLILAMFGIARGLLA